MPEIEEVRESVDVRVRLSALWIFFTLNHVYVNIASLFDRNISPNLSQDQLFGAAVLAETAIAMVPLSLFLKYEANRRANILVGVINTVAVVASLLGANPLYWVFFATIMLATSLVIIWQAWIWNG